MQYSRSWLPSGTHLRFILLAPLFLASSCIFLYSPWHPSELWSIRDPPESPSSTIPQKLWYKLGPKGLNDDTRAWTDSCIRNNKGYEVEIMTESSADVYVQSRFGASHPDLVEIYLGLTEGGIYSDLDVSCETPISEWIPPQYKDDAAVVVGWEFDVGWGDNIVREFATWVMMAKPGSPHMWMVVDDIILSLQKTMREKNVSVEELTLEIVGDVVDVTGPRRFTRSILTSMEEAFEATVQDMKNLLELKLIGDVLVLPGYAFAAYTNTYDEAMEVPPPLVKHHYAGSWKNENGGEKS